MKKLSGIIASTMLGLAIAGSGFLVHAQTSQYIEGWQIKDFTSHINISQNGNVAVKENINADFSNEAHHGILRAIPYQYANDLINYNVNLKLLSAGDSGQQDWDIQTYRQNGYFNVEIRAPEEKVLNNTSNFLLDYTAKNVIGFFEDHDEFYWNVNGTDWPVKTGINTAVVSLPIIINDTLKFDCFTGSYGIREKNCQYRVTGPKEVTFSSTIPLEAYENLTLAISMPKGTITPPGIIEKIWDFVSNNWGVPFFLITLLMMIILWYTKGRDDQSVPNTIMPHYKAPDGLLPTEIGILIDEKLDPRDLTATIIDLAVKGYLKITEIEKKGLFGKNYDYELELVQDYTGEKEYERLFVKAIFGVTTKGSKKKISELMKTFAINLPPIEKSVMKQMVKDGYFPQNPKTVRAIYITIAAFIAFGGLNFAATSTASILGILASAVTVALIGSKMPRKTAKGTKTYYELKGLYEYINTAEKDRMKFQEDQNILFEKLLPYAMSFGLIKKWAKAFDGLIQEPPQWFHSGRFNNGFTMIYFADALTDAGNGMMQNFAQPGSRGGGAWSGGSGFGGGGFSGGGFGGGGGRGL